jgi:hypothetical protein
MIDGNEFVMQPLAKVGVEGSNPFARSKFLFVISVS